MAHNKKHSYIKARTCYFLVFLGTQYLIFTLETQTITWIILIYQISRTEPFFVFRSLCFLATGIFFIANKTTTAYIRECNGYSFRWAISSLWWVTSLLAYSCHIVSHDYGRNYDLPLLLVWQPTAVIFSLSFSLPISLVSVSREFKLKSISLFNSWLVE